MDTAFIVLRKRKLIFLHWYHHATVLLVCWYAGATKQSAGMLVPRAVAGDHQHAWCSPRPYAGSHVLLCFGFARPVLHFHELLGPRCHGAQPAAIRVAQAFTRLIGTRGHTLLACAVPVAPAQYFYYYLAAIGRRVSWAPLVTAMQISQMFVGAWLCLKIEIAKRSGSECHVTPTCHLTTSLMYLSYLYLFCHFAWFRFGPGRSKGKATRSKRVTASPTADVAGPSGGDKLVRRFKPDVSAAAGAVDTHSAVAGPVAVARDAGDDLEAGVTPSAMHHMMAPEVRKKRAD